MCSFVRQTCPPRKRVAGQDQVHDFVSVSTKMGSGIQYMHQSMVVHHEVKGENYLMTVKDSIAPACKIGLTNFGASVWTNTVGATWLNAPEA
jgi:hypothetical protein